MKIWYVYTITFEDQTFYIGYRGTIRQIEDDFLVSYFSSSKIVKQKISDGYGFSGKIIKTFENQTDAYLFEQHVIKINFENPNILNAACYFGKIGFGILNEQSKIKRSNTLKNLWQTKEFREKTLNGRKDCWTEERKQNQSTRLKNIFWTEERKQNQSKKLTGRKNPKVSLALKGVPKPEGHGQKVSLANKGKSKSENHKSKLRGAKPKMVCRICDKKEMTLANFHYWLNPIFKKCEHCGKEMDPRNFARYHGSKCSIICHI